MLTSPQYVSICISCDIKWPAKYAMGFCFNSSGLVLLRYQCCHNSSSFFHNVFQWLGNCLVSNFITMCIFECKHSCWSYTFHCLWPLKCLMPKLRTAAPQRKSLTYLSVCNDVKMKYSSCKNARVQNHKIDSLDGSHHWKQHFSSMCALRCEGAWSEETCMHLALIQL